MPSRRALWRRALVRRCLAAALVGLAAWSTLGAVLPDEPEPGVPVLVAASDLPAGHRLEASDLRVGRWPQAVRPSRGYSRIDAAVGATLAGPLAAGDAVTRDRLVGSALLHGLPADRVIAHIPLADAGILQALRPGDRVDALSTQDGTVIGHDLVVLATGADIGVRPNTALTSGDAPGQQGVLVAATRGTAARLAVSQGAPAPGAGVMLTMRHRPR